VGVLHVAREDRAAAPCAPRHMQTLCTLCTLCTPSHADPVHPVHPVHSVTRRPCAPCAPCALPSHADPVHPVHPVHSEHTQTLCTPSTRRPCAPCAPCDFLLHADPVHSVTRRPHTVACNAGHHTPWCWCCQALLAVRNAGPLCVQPGDHSGTDPSVSVPSRRHGCSFVMYGLLRSQGSGTISLTCSHDLGAEWQPLVA